MIKNVQPRFDLDLGILHEGKSSVTNRAHFLLEILTRSMGFSYDETEKQYVFSTKSGHTYFTNVDLTPITHSGYIGQVSFGLSAGKESYTSLSLTGYNESFEVLGKVVSILSSLSQKYRVLALQFEAIGPRVSLYHSLIRHYGSKLGYELSHVDRDEMGYVLFLLLNKTITRTERNTVKDYFLGNEETRNEEYETTRR